MPELKKEVTRNTEVCKWMMFWRKVCIFAAIPFLIQTLLKFTEPGIGNAQWPLWIALVPLVPMVYYQFILTLTIHGMTSAFFHVLLTVVLTPFSYAGPILIPLLVKGDANRLSFINNR